MKLYDCRCYELLPRFARNAFVASLCGAVDELVRRIAVRCDALPCENSNLHTCRDDELAQIAEDLGVIPYYPDLPRATRENIILQAKIWTRYAGTSGAIVAMVNALFDTDTAVIDDEQDEPFLYEISVDGEFSQDVDISLRRYNECLEMLGHVTTSPNAFVFHYEGTFEPNTCAVSGDALTLYDTKSLCEYPANTIPIVEQGGIMTANGDSAWETPRWVPMTADE